MNKSVLHTKLAEVTHTIGGIAKRGTNDFHKYDYVRAEDVVEKVRVTLSSLGVSHTMRVKDVQLGTLVDDKNKTNNVATVQTVHEYTDSETGESIVAESVGQGIDRGDKAIPKALTMALKYHLRCQFLIPLGLEDAEADAGLDRSLHAPAPREETSARKAESERAGQKIVTAIGDLAVASGKRRDTAEKWAEKRVNKEKALERAVESAAKAGVDRTQAELALASSGLERFMEVFNAVPIEG